MANRNTRTPEEERAQEAIDAIATNIADLSNSVATLLSGRVKRKTLLILLAHTTGLKQGEVDAVLTALEQMGKTHLK